MALHLAPLSCVTQPLEFSPLHVSHGEHCADTLLPYNIQGKLGKLPSSESVAKKNQQTRTLSFLQPLGVMLLTPLNWIMRELHSYPARI